MKGSVTRLATFKDIAEAAGVSSDDIVKMLLQSLKPSDSLDI